MIPLDQMSIPAHLSGNNNRTTDEGGSPFGDLGITLGRAMSQPLPFGAYIRNGLSLLLITAAIAAFSVPLRVLYALSQTQEHYSHIILIPFISLYILYLGRRPVLASREWSPLGGAVLAGVGAWWYWQLGATAVDSDALPQTILSFLLVCWGIVTASFGIRSWRHASFGLVFLLFMVPFPQWLLDAFIGFLQRGSAEATDMLFGILGTPVFREGFVFSLSNFTIHVAEECSGIRSALSLVISSLVAGYLFLRTPWARVVLVTVVIPLALIKNAVRIVALALLANYVDPSFITNSVLHRSGGIPLFFMSLAILAGLVWLLRRAEKAQ